MPMAVVCCESPSFERERQVIVQKSIQFIATTTACLVLSGSAVMGADCTNRRATAQLVGPMIIAGFFGTRTSDPGFEHIIANLEGGRIGGVLLLGRNIVSRKDL